MTRTIALLAIVLTAACATAPTAPPASAPASAATASATPDCNPGSAILNATLWQQTAAEYDAVTMGTYANARRMVEAALADRTWTAEPQQTGDFAALPPAVILDVDETSLDNGRIEARAILAGKTYDAKMWEEWVHEANGGPVPGAAEFLTWCRSRGVTPFYITNRDVPEKAGTRANLEKLGYPLGEDTLIVRGEREEWKPSDKGPRRAWVASKYRVLLLLGDDLNDFANAREKSREERDRIVQDNAARWGRQWFMLPNSIYGSWERAITGGTGTPCEQFHKKMKALVP
jgi:5'-nucleotidase (lipoprotein e(P4) family)